MLTKEEAHYIYNSTDKFVLFLSPKYDSKFYAPALNPDEFKYAPFVKNDITGGPILFKRQISLLILYSEYHSQRFMKRKICYCYIAYKIHNAVMSPMLEL